MLGRRSAAERPHRLVAVALVEIGQDAAVAHFTDFCSSSMTADAFDSVQVAVWLDKQQDGLFAFRCVLSAQHHRFEVCHNT